VLCRRCRFSPTVITDVEMMPPARRSEVRRLARKSSLSVTPSASEGEPPIKPRLARCLVTADEVAFTDLIYDRHCANCMIAEDARDQRMSASEDGPVQRAR
jgi:hypothetical protein